VQKGKVDHGQLLSDLNGYFAEFSEDLPSDDFSLKIFRTTISELLEIDGEALRQAYRALLGSEGFKGEARLGQ